MNPEMNETPAWLAQYEPQIPLATLVEEVNRIYHSFDARKYDRQHPEIHRQLPAIWHDMITQLPECSSWRILDFGCGTGFEAQQVLEKLGARVDALIAYDPSPEMLDRCKRRLQGSSQVIFSRSLEEALESGPFDLLLTNSLLHHLPNIRRAISSLIPSLKNGAFWLAGHEPSARFYNNKDCVHFLEQYQVTRKVTKWLKPELYAQKISQLLKIDSLNATARSAYKRGIFKQTPTAEAINRIVDFHVAHSLAEASQGRGLDFEQLRADFAGTWELTWFKSYAYFGNFNPTRVGQRWRKRAARLAERFPSDGANFSAVWARSL